MERRDAPLWKPTSILRHAQADGTSHFDWLLGVVAHCDNPHLLLARCFRCALCPKWPIPSGSSAIQEIGMHRWFYLGLSKPYELSQGRGIVHPVARGMWREAQGESIGADEILEVLWSDSKDPRQLRITPAPDARVFEVDPVR